MRLPCPISGTPSSKSGYSTGRFAFFFFSSRRRHTRLQGDWSSDVCSSDLTASSTAGAGPGSGGGGVSGGATQPEALADLHPRAQDLLKQALAELAAKAPGTDRKSVV